MWKKVDERIRTLIENGVKQRHRSIFLIVGDKSRDQIVNLNHILSKALVKAKPTTLWCYKDRLEISSHRKKRAKNIKTLMRTGLLDPEKADPFSLFVESGGITYCLYKDSERILGNTFSMCILQDFEALTPNLLARTIETVEGGGLILLLLRSLSSLTSLCTMVMDVHQRFRTESHSEAAGRFNERFLLSLASCKACVVMDDEFNILPISSHIRSIKPVPTKEDSEGLSEVERDLKILKEQLNEEFPVGPLIKKCCTLDQGKAVITFLDAVLDKTLQSTVALLAARGRGKSAALGLAVSGAVAAGYSNIYITAPSPENLKTLFEFVLKGFDSLEYKEHTDYDVVKCSNTEYNMGKQSSSRGSNQVIVRINIYKQHRQTIQYIQPNEGEKLSQVELLVIDEAAAIPLPIVKSLLGPYLVFISSTVNGYEGTGRSLSLKLLHQLEEQSQTSTKGTEGALSGRLFKKIELSESIRYAPGDPIELWLNGLLCLDVANYIPNIHRLPPPEKCDLYYVNRDTLFSYHKDSELFLQRMMALYVASHYKNSPNDLQLMSDAPAHHLFVLLGPVDESKNHLPDILCVVQVCLEGQISHKSAMKSLSEGYQPHGDQIPWKFCEQFRDTEFPSLSGARIVRIATHPSATRLGYGSKAVELLTSYYEGCFTSISEIDEEDVEKPPVSVIEAAQKVSLLEENIKPRSNLPPLLVHLRERRQERLHYVGVSFGLTQDLFRFWRKLEFFPFYISQIPNAVTGEHTCMVLKPLKNEDVEFGDFFTRYYNEFRARFIGLLGPCFSSMHFKLAMSILEPKINFSESEKQDSNLDEVLQFLKNTPHALKLLEAYANGLADFHLIIDLLRPLAGLYFLKKVPVTLQYIQASILLLMGLQHQDVSYTKDQMQLERDQIMSNLKKVMTKLYKFVYSIASKDVESTIPRPKEQIVLKPHSISLDEDLNEAARQVQEQMRGAAEADGISEKKHDDKSAQQEPPSPAISGEAVEKAVKALLKWKDCQPNSEKPQLLSSDDYVYLVVTVKKIPSKSRTNPYKIPLVHPLFSPASDGSELCLFLDDRPDRLPSSKDAKAKIASESIPIPKVIKLSKLETDYKPFEAKRKLCDSYDLFLADRRIIPLLPKHLGKHFFKNKIPVAVDLEHQNWKEQVERICSSALLHLSTGTCSTVRVARSSMAPADIVENVMAAINGVAETVPRKWSNLRSLHLKRSDSVALPIYQSLPEANLNVIGLLEEGTSEEGSVDVASLGKKRGREGQDLLSSKKSPKASSKKGRIHQVRYMDDAIDKAAAAAEENVVKVKKAKKKEASSKFELVEG